MCTETMLTLAPFHPSDQAAVKKLILAGLVEHWGFLDAAKNPDLEDIATSYAEATFMVARLNDRIVGTGALVPHGDGLVEIVRMSVVKEMRRQGVGRSILEALLEQARALGFRQVILETTATWHEVVEFYQRCGFQVTHHQDGDVYFMKDITDLLEKNSADA
jgi:putative acetyltransferase